MVAMTVSAALIIVVILHASQAVGFKTAWVPRPLEYGPGRTIDTTPDPDFDYSATDFLDLAAQL